MGESYDGRAAVPSISREGVTQKSCRVTATQSIIKVTEQSAYFGRGGVTAFTERRVTGVLDIHFHDIAPPHPRNTDSDRAKGHVALPHIGGVTEPISRLIRKTGVAAHAKPHTTISSILVAPKDKDHPQDKCGVVYQLTCG